MASEVKRPERPSRRKSDVPLDTTSRLLNADLCESACNVKSPVKTSISIAQDKTVEETSLKIIKQDIGTESTQPHELIVLRTAPRPPHPKGRHKTLHSEFPTLELQNKGSGEEKTEFENKELVESLQSSPSLREAHVSKFTSETSSPKPIIKPKPVFHSVGQPGKVAGQHETTQQSGVHYRQKSLGQQCTNQLNDGQESSSHQSTIQQENCPRNSNRKVFFAEKTCHERTSHESNQEGKATLSITSVISNEPASCQQLCNDPVPSESHGIDVPVYAQVNKTKKTKESNECSQNQVSKSSHLKSASDVTSTDVSAVIAKTSIVPPKKPPRTFAHDEYLRLRAAKHERHGSVPAARTIESEYEEIESPPITNDRASLTIFGSKRDDHSNQSSIYASDYAESGKCDAVKRRSTGDKLPAPPRPPPPSVVHKTGTVLTKKSREESPVNKPFQFGSPNIQCSDQTSKETRMSTSPRLVDVNVQKRKSKEMDPNDSKLNVSERIIGDGIYSEPDVILPQTSVDSPADDPLYEVPGMVTKFQSSTVAVDAGGYSLPDVQKNQSQQVSLPSGTGLQPSTVAKSTVETKPVHPGLENIRHQPTQRRISSAYSILRLNVEPTTDSSNENHETTDDDSDAEVTKDEQERRLKHISNVRKRTSFMVSKYVTMKLSKPSQLYDFALIVGLQLDEDKKCHPQVLFQYPEKLPSEQSSARVELFCFPDAEIWRPVTIYDGEMFSFALTNQLGLRQYGYCRRLLPSGSGNRLPAALCIVSSVGEICMYEQLLRSVEERFIASEEQAQDLLRSSYSHLCPEPNREIFIVTTPGSKKQPVILRRAGESRPDVVSCDALLTYLSTSVLIKVFGSVLLERHVVFCSQKLSTLTSCIHTLLSLLYPFEWQHVFVPVLPSCMTDVLGSPTPFVIGILSSTYAKLLQNESITSEILVIDLDGGSLLHCYGDEEHIIPEKLQKALSTALKDDSDSIGVRDAAVTEAFLRFFIETCGHFTDFISTRQDGKLDFDAEQFTGAVSSRSIQMFLEWFSQTQMFEVFIREELHGMKHELFLSRIMEYREEMTEMTTSLKQNMKMMRKKIKDFFIESGGKLRRKFQRNVFI